MFTSIRTFSDRTREAGLTGETGGLNIVAADYDNPQDWFDFLFVTNAGSGGACYSNPALDSLVKTANTKSLTDGLAGYKQANQILVDQVITGPLVYYIHGNVVHPWVKGVDGNALYDFYWSDARILQHS